MTLVSNLLALLLVVGFVAGFSAASLGWATMQQRVIVQKAIDSCASMMAEANKF